MYMFMLLFFFVVLVFSWLFFYPSSFHDEPVAKVNAIRSGSEIEGWTPEEELGFPRIRSVDETNGRLVHRGPHVRP